jgi:four helix bundle protein
MSYQDFKIELEGRTKNFAISTFRLTASLPNIAEANVVRNQLAKSASSIGANYREANRARSKADFINKISICESEASETEFWIELIQEMKWASNEESKKLQNEANELLKIFTTIGRKTKEKNV